MSDPRFTLAVVASLDGYIARWSGHSPAGWASAEEQALFFADVAAADWCIMGRHTHRAADRPDRHRIVFSTTVEGWQRPTQLWLNPQRLAPELGPATLAALVAPCRPLTRGLILGGTTVHDWFHAARAIHRIHLTVEPVRFGSGLPIFAGAENSDPVKVLSDKGYTVRSDTRLNAQGTRYLVLTP